MAKEAANEHERQLKELRDGAQHEDARRGQAQSVYKIVPSNGAALRDVDGMSGFIDLDANAPATLQAVVEAIARLSTLSESEILELVSEGRLKDLFPFEPRPDQRLPPDFLSDEQLIEARPVLRDEPRRRARIQSSMPSCSLTVPCKE